VVAVDYTHPSVVCERYQYLCDSVSLESGCTAADVGKYKWMYAGAEEASCKFSKENPQSHIKGNVCCRSDRCNAPDPRLDRTTRCCQASLVTQPSPDHLRGARAVALHVPHVL